MGSIVEQETFGKIQLMYQHNLQESLTIKYLSDHTLGRFPKGFENTCL